MCYWKYRERNTHYKCLPSEYSKTRKQTSSQFIVQLLLLAVRYSHCRQPDASFSHSKSLSQIQNIHGPLYRLRLRLSFLNIIKKVQFPNFSKDVTRWVPRHGGSAPGWNYFLGSNYRSPTWWTLHLQPVLHATFLLSHFVGLVSKSPLLYFLRGVKSRIEK